jgi:hypothetical protein
VIEKQGAAYQEQHELGRHDALSPKSGRCHAPNRRFRPDCICSDIVLDGNWALLRVVTSIDKRGSSWRINNGGLSKEVISEEVKAVDPAISEGGVREVGFKA